MTLHILVEEARVYTLKEFCGKLRLDEDTCAKIVLELGGIEARAARALSKAGFDASEARPASIHGDRVYTGDWVGYAALGQDAVLEVKPKYKRLYRDAIRALRTLRVMGFELLVARLEAVLSKTGAPSLAGLLTVLQFIEEWASSQQPGPRLYTTIASMVYAALSSLRGLPSPPPSLAASFLAESPLVAYSLVYPYLDEPDVDAVIEARLLASMRTAQGTSGSIASWATLLPSPKLYELIILADTLEALHNAGCEITSTASLHATLECKDIKARIYYNRAPRSRIVELLSGERLRPDIVVELHDRLVVIEAKYRRCPPRLTKGDATRIAAYLADVNPDAIVIVYPECKPKRDRPLQGNILEITRDEVRETIRRLLLGLQS